MDETLLLVILVVVAIVFAVPYALAISMYTFPLFLVWLLTPVRFGPEPGLVIDRSPHPQLAKLRAQKRDAEKQYADIRYSDCGIRWSDNLGRFEERSIRGRDLNEQLEYWEAEVERIGAEISQAASPENEAVADWSEALRVWYGAQARNAAKQAGWKLALPVFVGVWVVAELLGVVLPHFIGLFAFAWNPAPGFLHPGIALGSLAGWAVGMYRVSNPPKLFVEFGYARIREYRDAKEAREQAEDSKFGTSSNKDSFKEQASFEEQDDEETGEEAWYEVLGVSPDATKDEIKAAHRTKIKEYHPDRVSGLGEKLRVLADFESKKLNAAKEEGLSLRG